MAQIDEDQSLGFLWLGVGAVLLIGLIASGRTPVLAGGSSAGS